MTVRQEGMGLHKTSMRLADGRELIYYDDRPGAGRATTDLRTLFPSTTPAQIRHDPLLDEWVVMASHRQARTHLPPADQCPLCPSGRERLTEIPAEDYDVVVFENRFPSLSSHTAQPAGPHDGLLARRPGFGRCEVVCFTADHQVSFARLSPERLATVGAAWVDRIRTLSRLPGVEYVFCFENRGEEIGVTLHHPHGQIYAYPFVPPRVRRELDSAGRWRDRTGECLFCGVLEAELAEGQRVVALTDRFVAFVPAAAHWPFEVHLYPRRHVADLAALDDGERRELLALQAEILGRFDRLFDRPMPYVMALVQAPVSGDRDLAHMRLEAFSVRRSAGKLKYLAGSEAAAGVFISDVLPERAAELLSLAGPSGRLLRDAAR
jgi:UDPglucose--hexose-1-phosphate uridylyltransferase